MHGSWQFRSPLKDQTAPLAESVTSAMTAGTQTRDRHVLRSVLFIVFLFGLVVCRRHTFEVEWRPKVLPRQTPVTLLHALFGWKVPTGKINQMQNSDIHDSNNKKDVTDGLYFAAIPSALTCCARCACNCCRLRATNL